MGRRLDWPAGEAWLHAARGTGFATYGQFGRSLAHGHEGVRIATAIGHQLWAATAQTMLGWIYARALAPDRAVLHLEEGHAFARDVGSAWWIAFSAGYLALTHLQTGALDRAAAALAGLEPLGRPPHGVPERHVAWARAVVASQAETIDDEPLRAHFLAAALASLPSERPPTPLRAAKQVADGLTAREREVAALVAQGKSNRAIAAALVVGEPTVATHVSHILGPRPAPARHPPAMHRKIIIPPPRSHRVCGRATATARVEWVLYPGAALFGRAGTLPRCGEARRLPGPRAIVAPSEVAASRPAVVPPPARPDSGYAILCAWLVARTRQEPTPPVPLTLPARRDPAA